MYQTFLSAYNINNILYTFQKENSRYALTIKSPVVWSIRGSFPRREIFSRFVERKFAARENDIYDNDPNFCVPINKRERESLVHSISSLRRNNTQFLSSHVSGNLMVIFVVTFSRRLRSITNFFLANLAVADFCVGIFCVYQTLTNYLMNSWQLGDFLCKVYMFVHALSYTASILILVVVCTERYLAIVHPIKCRSMLTRSRLRMVIGVVWILAAVYASPRFVYVETISNRLNNGDVDIICIANIKKHNKNVLDAVNLVFLYLLPLFLMCCLYTRIAVGLWRSGATLGGPGLVARTRNGRVHHVHTSSRNVLRARRGVIRYLSLFPTARYRWSWFPLIDYKRQLVWPIVWEARFLCHYTARLIERLLLLIFQDADRSGDDVRRVQPAAAGAHRLAALGFKLRPHVGFQYPADRINLPGLVHELLPEPAAVRFPVA